MLQKLKNRIFEILDVTASDKLPTRIFDVFIITLIFLNVLAVILETVESLSSQYKPFFRKFLGAIIAILGIGTIALPVGILTSGFAKEIQRRHRKRNLCPHCGKDIDKPSKT